MESETTKPAAAAAAEAEEEKTTLPPSSEAPAQKDATAKSSEAQAASEPAVNGGEDPEYSAIKKYHWDPFNNVDLNPPDVRCLNRIKKDIVELYSSPVPGILVSADQNDVTIVHALITGPFSTPYEGGFFYFVFRFPNTYPFDPPKVKLMTTGNGSVRFNPNLYSNGKVCLSIIGTWLGPKWLPSQTLSSVLLSIQSLLNEKPYHNEPGYEKERHPNGVKLYNEFIQYQTLRVAVCNALERLHLIPEDFHDTLISSFLASYDFYEEICVANKHKDGQELTDPLFAVKHGLYSYSNILERLAALKKKYEDHESQLDKTFEED